MNLSRYWIFLVLVLLWAALAFFYENKIFNPHFVDEEDNLVLGYYLLQNEKLYKDMFSHHQPLAYVFSAGIQKVTNPNSIYLLVKRHREAIVVWGFLWSIVMVYFLKSWGVVFVLVYEVLKIQLLGNLFLSESLGVYPLVVLTILVFFVKLRNYFITFFIGVCLGLVIFLLSPLWPAAGFLTLVYLSQIKVGRFMHFLILTIVVLMIFAKLLIFMDIRNYFLYAFYTNFFYYIPITSKNNLAVNFLYGILTPLTAFSPAISSSPTIWIIRLLSLGMFGAFWYLLKEGKWRIGILGFVFLGLGNIRYVAPGTDFYKGFHILPWFGLLIILTILYFINLEKLPKRVVYGFVGLVIAMTLYFGFAGLFEKRIVKEDYFVNYSHQENIGMAVGILGDSQDELFVAPDEWLVYWQSKVRHASIMVNFYAWMNEVPYLKEEVDKMFKEEPPEFVFLSMPGTGFENLLEGYSNLMKGGKETGLFVKMDKLKDLSMQQMSDLKFHNFEFKP